jgi:putative ABC transport system permease protein
VQRRRSELRLLSSRGISPPLLGLKAAAELGLPAAVGCLLGWAAALVLVPRLGPSALLEPGAPAAGLLAAAVAWAGCLATIVAVGAVVTAELRLRRSPRLLHAGLVTAVLALIAAAVRLGRATDLQQLARVVVIDPAMLLAPVLAVIELVLAAALLVVAPLQRARRPARHAASPSSPPSTGPRPHAGPCWPSCADRPSRSHSRSTAPGSARSTV